MKRLSLLLCATILLCTLFILGCDKLQYFEEGQYFCNNNELIAVESVDDFYIDWTDNVTSEQQEAVRSILAALVRMPSGVFYMGSPAISDATPTHHVTVSNFYIGKYEITQKQWCAVMEEPGRWNDMQYGRGDNYPAYGISYDEAVAFVQKLTELTQIHFRLPTEAEWEYAARGGNMPYLYSGSDMIDFVGWHYGNAEHAAHPIGNKAANTMGLMDMSGNVCEWCSDFYGPYSMGHTDNPTGPQTGTQRVVRGGAYCLSENYCRCCARDKFYPDQHSVAIGLRVVVTL